MDDNDDGKTTEKGLPSTWRFQELERTAPGVLDWSRMDLDARLNACLAALLAQYRIDPETIAYDPRPNRRVVFVWRQNQREPEKTDVAVRSVESADVVRSKGLALLGARWADVERACGLSAARAAKVFERTFR